jgi:hypothetical protein
MKPMSLLACGIVVSSLSVAIQAHAESPAGNFALRAETQASLQAWKKQPVRSRATAEPVPRGDLRGDIASNARARPEPDRGDRQHRR